MTLLQEDLPLVTSPNIPRPLGAGDQERKTQVPKSQAANHWLVSTIPQRKLEFWVNGLNPKQLETSLVFTWFFVIWLFLCCREVLAENKKENVGENIPAWGQGGKTQSCGQWGRPIQISSPGTPQTEGSFTHESQIGKLNIFWILTRRWSQNQFISQVFKNFFKSWSSK